MSRLYLRIMSSVLLRCEGRVLMHHRAPNRKIAPNLWAIPGGHMEPDEIRTPMANALRELWEETGVGREQLASFGLRYVLLSPQDGELRMHFDYVAEIAKEPELTANDEGTLHWTPMEETLSLEMRPSMRALFRHYVANPNDRRVHMGMMEENEIDFLPTDTSPEAGFRPAAGVIARCGEKLLLLHRANDKEIAPGMWSNVGGHMEPEELHDPAATALREFHEEAGIEPLRLGSVALRGAMLVAKPNEFGMLFNYAAELSEPTEVPRSEDGSFHWSAPEEVEKLPMTPAMKALALHEVVNGVEPILGLVRGEDVRAHRWPGAC